MPRRIALTAVVVPDVGFMVGLTEEGLGGYVPMPEFGTFATYEAAAQAADKANRERLGLTPEYAIRIVLGSFRKEAA